MGAAKTTIGKMAYRNFLRNLSINVEAMKKNAAATVQATSEARPITLEWVHQQLLRLRSTEAYLFKEDFEN